MSHTTNHESTLCQGVEGPGKSVRSLQCSFASNAKFHSLDLAAACRYADAGAYAGKFRALQQRALSAVRSRVSSVLRHASEQVTPRLYTTFCQ